MSRSFDNWTEIPVKLNINRIYGGDGERPMRIEIIDDISGTIILRADFSFENFMRALTGQAAIEGAGKVFLCGPVGCTTETKREALPRPKGNRGDGEEAKRLLNPFEVDGWVGTPDDLYNHHCWADDGKVSVMFRRYVRPDGTIWERSNQFAIEQVCHVNALREVLLKAFMEYDTREGITAATLTHIATVLEQTAPKERHQ